MRAGDAQGQQNPQQPHPHQQRRSELPTAVRELLAGFAAGAANVTSGYPFDTVKVRLQSASPGQYCGALHCLRTIVRHEGFRRGLFRGLSSPLVGGTAETGVNYLVYSRVLGALRPADGSATTLISVAAAGAVAGVALSAVLGPTELVKCRMQQVGSAARYPGGPLQCLREVVATEGGLRGLARGLGATMVREVPGNALFFVAYEGLRRELLEAGPHRCTQQVKVRGYGAADVDLQPQPSAAGPLPPPPPSSPPGLLGFTARADVQRVGGGGPGDLATAGSLEHQEQQPGATAAAGGARCHWLTEAAVAVFCGGAAGTLMWAAVLPIDVAKTRLQTARPGSEWDVNLRKHWVMLWREGGLRSLYAGLTPTLVRAFPANACQWLAWELVMQGLHDSGEGAC